jgi:hypothetical protein
MCNVRWAPNGRFLFVTVMERSLTDPGQMLIIPLQPGEMLPPLPVGGIKSVADAAYFPGARIIEARGSLAPGLEAGTYAFVKSILHRNLFQITLPEP